MSSNVRSFLHCNHSHDKDMNIEHQQQISQETRLPIADDCLPTLSNVNEWITNIDSQQKSINLSCCGGDEKKNNIKNQIKAPRLTNETVDDITQSVNSTEQNDDNIEHVVPQHAQKVDTDDNLKDLLAKEEIKKAIINQLAQRALHRPMNSNNDAPPRLCTKKHVRNRL